MPSSINTKLSIGMSISTLLSHNKHQVRPEEGILGIPTSSTPQVRLNWAVDTNITAYLESRKSA